MEHDRLLDADRTSWIEITPERALGERCCGMLPALRWSSEEAEELSSMLKALAHPVRLQIVDLLRRFGGQVCVCDIEAQFDLSQPTISHHLKVLRQAGIIDSVASGVWVYYFTRPEALARLQAVLAGLSE